MCIRDRDYSIPCISKILYFLSIMNTLPSSNSSVPFLIIRFLHVLINIWLKNRFQWLKKEYCTGESLSYFLVHYKLFWKLFINSNTGLVLQFVFSHIKFTSIILIQYLPERVSSDGVESFCKKQNTVGMLYSNHFYNCLILLDSLVVLLYSKLTQRLLR